MGKRLLGAVVALAVLLAGVCASAWGQERIRLVVNGREVYPDVPPQIINGRTMVPLRAVAEALGADVRWDEAGQVVYVSGGKSEVVLGLLNKYNATISYLRWIESFFNGPDLILDRQAAFVVASNAHPAWRDLTLKWLEDYVSMAQDYGNTYLESAMAKMTWEAMSSVNPEFVIPAERLKALVEESMTLHAATALRLSEILSRGGEVTEEDNMFFAQIKNRRKAVRDDVYNLLRTTQDEATDKHIRLVSAIYQNQ